MHRVFTIEIPGIATLFFPAYVTFASIGLFCAMLVAYFRISKTELMNFKRFLILVGFIALGVVVGSKLLFILTQLPHFMEDPSIDNIIHIVITSGFVFYGGLLGALLALYLYARVFKISYRQLSNIIAPSFPLFHMWGRIGCAFAGCCYGVVSDWGIVMEDEPGVIRLPVQFFESGVLLFIFIILLIVEKKYRDKVALMPLYLSLYAVARFILEFFRGDTIRGIWFGLSTSQWISLSIVVVIAVRGMLNYRKQYNEYHY